MKGYMNLLSLKKERMTSCYSERITQFPSFHVPLTKSCRKIPQAQQVHLNIFNITECYVYSPMLTAKES